METRAKGETPADARKHVLGGNRHGSPSSNDNSNSRLRHTCRHGLHSPQKFLPAGPPIGMEFAFAAPMPATPKKDTHPPATPAARKIDVFFIGRVSLASGRELTRKKNTHAAHHAHTRTPHPPV